MADPADALISLSPYQGRTLAAVFDRLFPADEHSASASERPFSLASRQAS